MIPLILLAGIGLLAFLAISGKVKGDTMTEPSQPAGDLTPMDTQKIQYNITTDKSTWPSGDKIWDICRAVAIAEGYNTNGAAFKLNNPGDLSSGDEHGQPTAGAPEWHGGSNIIHFARALDGWNALYAKISNIVNGSSKVYQQNWTISQISALWAGDSTAWANNVARELGYDDPTQYGFDDYVGGGGGS